MSIIMRYAARSDVGLVRTENQDSGYAGPHLLVLADGMGGPAGGDIASSVAVAHLVNLDEDVPAANDLLDTLRQALVAAHTELEERARQDPELAGLGTTCIAVLRTENKMAMVHIGDSRAYLMREGRLTQITTDHTFVQYLVDTGKISPEEAEHHPQRSVVLRVLGDTDGDVILDETMREARPGDRWLLCSDGLSGIVSDETIGETLQGVEDPAECAEELISLALRGGGHDNVTCVIADVLDAEDLADGTAPRSTPEVVGAAATPRLQRSRGTAGAAGRAAALAAAAGSSDEDTSTEARLVRRRWWPRVLGLLLVLAVVVGGGLWGYRWTQEQYYLATDGDVVGIYRGIPQEVASLKLSHLHETTDLAVAELPTYAQNRIAATITVGSLEQARHQLDTLREAAEQSSNPRDRDGNQGEEETRDSEEKTTDSEDSSATSASARQARHEDPALARDGAGS